jgi:hypothetical protein
MILNRISLLGKNVPSFCGEDMEYFTSESIESPIEWRLQLHAIESSNCRARMSYYSLSIWLWLLFCDAVILQSQGLSRLFSPSQYRLDDRLNQFYRLLGVCTVSYATINHTHRFLPNCNMASRESAILGYVFFALKRSRCAPLALSTSIIFNGHRSSAY